MDLYWLPEPQDWPGAVRRLDRETDRARIWAELVVLANTRLDLVRTHRLDKTLQRHFAAEPPPGLASGPVRLALLGSSTLGHLVPAIRVAGARHGLWIRCHEGAYGQFMQELADPGSVTRAFAPATALLALDARHVTRGLDPTAGVEAAAAALVAASAEFGRAWALAREAGIDVIQQTVLPVFAPLIGENEHRLASSKARFVAAINEWLRREADAEGVDLLAIDAFAADQGVSRWHNPVYWLSAKQEVSAAAAMLYADHLVRLIAARQGRSRKCLALDLDNTLWGGVIGDDGLDGIVVGEGSASGEAFLDLQATALHLAKRGVILAVCSKNDEANAKAPFERHPDMLLRLSDISCFVANWRDKAANLRRIAAELNIGLDALVFVDDNPFERNLVRAELPMVATPEIPDDPARVARTILDAGYFEGVAVTNEDRERTGQYRANAERQALQASATDLPAYLRSLAMELIVKPFDRLGLQRIVQLINKTNQFNLTTRRMTEAEVVETMQDPEAFGLQFRLVDRFGDNGIIAIVVGRREADEVALDVWLMSCRVLGRRVEQATLSVAVEAARALGGKRLIGRYVPSAKNAMVKDHYARLGFTRMAERDDGETVWAFDLVSAPSSEIIMKITRG